MRKIKVHAEINSPKVPNFLRSSSGEAIPICAVSDEGLNMIADQWRKDLLERAEDMHRELYGKPRPAPAPDGGGEK